MLSSKNLGTIKYSKTNFFERKLFYTKIVEFE